MPLAARRQSLPLLPITRGLVGYYNMKVFSESTLHDLSSLLNNCTLQNSPAPTNGGLDFNGSSQYVLVPRPFVPSSTQDVSFITVALIDVQPTSPFRFSAWDDTFVMTVRHTSPYDAAFAFRSASSTYVEARVDSAFPIATPMFLAGIKNGVDAILWQGATKITQAGASSNVYFVNNSRFALAAMYATGSPTQYLNGQIALTLFYNRALADDEIGAIHEWAYRIVYRRGWGIRS